MSAMACFMMRDHQSKRLSATIETMRTIAADTKSPPQRASFFATIEFV
jgi:hypothetical protein